MSCCWLTCWFKKKKKSTLNFTCLPFSVSRRLSANFLGSVLQPTNSTGIYMITNGQLSCKSAGEGRRTRTNDWTYGRADLLFFTNYFLLRTNSFSVNEWCLQDQTVLFTAWRLYSFSPSLKSKHVSAPLFKPLSICPYCLFLNSQGSTVAVMAQRLILNHLFPEGQLRACLQITNFILFFGVFFLSSTHLHTDPALVTESRSVSFFPLYHHQSRPK